MADLSRELADVSQSLEAVSRWLAPIPGRKHVALYSAGHAIRPAQALIALLQSRFPASARTVASELAGFETNEGVEHVRRVVDEANRAQVSFYAIDGYQRTFPLAEVLRDGVFLALKVNGQVLPKEHGYPLRLVMEGKEGNNWIKWVNHIELTQQKDEF